MKTEKSYSDAIYEAFNYLLKNHKEVFIMGQGLWSPWYVGNTMKNLEIKYGTKRIIDTPVSELAVTGAAFGASLTGKKPIVVHPRMDFMLYAMDTIINQISKWRYVMGGNVKTNITIRGIINRGGEQGAQHSQSFHSLFASIPGLKVVMPFTVKDSRDLLISSVLSEDPVIFIDDRWLYEKTEKISNKIVPKKLSSYKPQVLIKGKDITLISCGFSTELALQSANILKSKNINAEVIDLRTLSISEKGWKDPILKSVNKTKRFVCIDGGWAPCSISSEVTSLIFENISLSKIKSKPIRISLPFSPAPTSSNMEEKYYPSPKYISGKILKLFNA